MSIRHDWSFSYVDFAFCFDRPPNPTNSQAIKCRCFSFLNKFFIRYQVPTLVKKIFFWNLKPNFCLFLFRSFYNVKKKKTVKSCFNLYLEIVYGSGLNFKDQSLSILIFSSKHECIKHECILWLQVYAKVTIYNIAKFSKTLYKQAEQVERKFFKRSF